jgi:hypothetical protein
LSVQDFLDRFEWDFPYAEDVLKLLRTSDARLTFAAPVARDAPPGSWELHVRLPLRLERYFGISKQFVAYCTCVKDLQPRDVARLKRLITSARNTVEQDFALLFSADSAGGEKVRNWGVDRSHGVIVVPVEREQLAALVGTGMVDNALRDLIGSWVSSYNLYDERGPVTGEQFFGRGDLLRDLDRKLAQGRGHVGIFGLRRIGKTSLLLELNDRLRSRPNVHPVFIDLERSSSTAHVAWRVSRELAWDSHYFSQRGFPARNKRCGLVAKRATRLGRR